MSIEQANGVKFQLSRMFSVPHSAIVWKGGNCFIIVYPSGTEVNVKWK